MAGLTSSLQHADASVDDASPRYDAVVIGASAGGVSALQTMLSRLPASFPLPILLVLHLSRTIESRLPEVLGYRTRMCCKWAEQGERMAPGTVHVAPRDRHLVLAPGGRLRLLTSPPVRWWRPAIDTLFDSAAAMLGERTAAIVLSGVLQDGTNGMAAIRDAGGITIAQDEASADHFDMPASAIDVGGADIILSPTKIAEALMVLASSGGRTSPD